MDLPPDFRELLAEFARSGVEAVLVGGYAVAFHGRPRATKDIDLVLEGSAANLERAADARTLRRALGGRGSRSPAGAGRHRLHGPAALARRLLAHNRWCRFRQSRHPCRRRGIDGVPLRVIELSDLIANKRAVGRPQDVVDADFLERVRARQAPARR